MACAKALLETLCRYLAHHLRGEGSCINVVRAGLVRTDSLRAVLGDIRLAELEQRFPQVFIDPAEIAAAVLSLCSGGMDAVSGQVITVDRGWSFSTNSLFSDHQGS